MGGDATPDPAEIKPARAVSSYADKLCNLDEMDTGSQSDTKPFEMFYSSYQVSPGKPRFSG